jgi:NAD(P)-dependent dehydrogenase (short-subunit alcohol dehydrogenase family)
MGTPKLLGSTAAITGASRGIGFAIALRFAMEGAKVVMLGRNQEGLLNARNHIERFSGVNNAPSFQLETRVHDVKRPDHWKDLAEFAVGDLIACRDLTPLTPPSVE